MAKGKTTAFFCKECGYESVKWLGQCPGCREWNTFVEEPVVKAKSKGITGTILSGGRAKPSPVSEISIDEEDRILTDIGVSVSEYDISKHKKEKTLLFTLM